MNTDIDKRKTPEENSFGVFSDSHRIQTCNLLIRSQMLYSVELGSRDANAWSQRSFVTPTGFKPVTF